MNKKLNIYLLAILCGAGVAMATAPYSRAAAVDTDKDGLSDEIEIKLSSDPRQPDTDGDGFYDGLEAMGGFNPLKSGADRALERSVLVNLDKQRLEVKLGGVTIKTIPVSTGLRRTPTPIGEFKIEKKKPKVNYVGRGYNYPNTKWNLQFKPSYYLHGTYWHAQFGKRPMSHGCVNISYQNAEFLYKFMDVGDKVKIVGKTPLGKVAA